MYSPLTLLTESLSKNVEAMKTIKYLLTIVVLAATCSVNAQSRSHRIDLGVGYSYKSGLAATMAYEHETRYYHTFEFGLDAYLQWAECPSCGRICPDSFWNSYNTFSGFGVWKPCVLRKKNSHGNIRLGASFGTDREKFVAGILIGYERNYAITNGWVFYWQIRSDLMINAKDLFRPGLTIGVKFPIYKNSL